MNRPCVKNSLVTEAGRFTNRPYGRGVLVIDGVVLDGVGAWGEIYRVQTADAL